MNAPINNTPIKQTLCAKPAQMPVATQAERQSARSNAMHTHNPRQKNRLLRQLAQLGLLALSMLSPVIAAQAAVTVDQSPLIIQKPLAPNIVLMLDDSGSLSWDFMPDFGYLKNNGNNDALINSSNNGVYYDPTITYLPPLKVDGTSYTNQTDFTKTPNDGFGTISSDMIDLTNYNGYDDTGYINYSKSVLTNSSYVKTGISSDDCYSLYYNDQTAYDYSYSKAKKNSPSLCTIYTQVSSGYFQYSTGVAAGPYTVHYVANTSCGTQSNCVIASDTTGASAPVGVAAGNNIANWYAYYHTRILTVKTGLTLAFANLDPSYRFGFGSIDGNNNSALPSNKYSYADSYNGGTNYIAQVTPFGNGAANTQKSNFWKWITSEYANNGTPLRQALDQVGKYYQTAQPWVTGGTGTDAASTYACRPAFAILTTDGFWNDSFSSVGNVDNSNGTAITSPSSYQYLPIAPYKDGVSNTLADVAMKYWETDLQPTISNEVPTTPNDPAFWQHMTTFTVGLGWSPVGITPSTLTIPQIFSWANTGNPPTGVTSMTWPTPSSNSINNIADLAHAAVNGHGNFFSVKNPNDFINGIGSALASIADRMGAGNAITQSGTTLPTVSSATDPLFQFRATYYTGQWTGALTAATYNTATPPPSYTPAWSTNTWSPTFTTVSGVTLSNRNVWTTKDGTAAQSVAFKTAANLSSAEQTGLAAYSGTPAQTMLNYLLGDKTYEIGSVGGTLRARKATLGDVVSSTPVYVAAPDKTLFENASFTGASTYQSFVTANTNRAPVVYTAANDGMLHAFRATKGAGYDITGTTATANANQPAGTEVYAYMPAAVLTQTGAASITNLANPQYGVVSGVDGTQAVPHQYYNDGRITVQNVYFSSDSAWHTVLVGTTGRGPAKAIYALDITNPSVLMNPATAQNALLWERWAGDGKTGSNYIGEMVGTPVIAQIKQDGATTPSWAVFVGNGYNSSANTAALLQFNLQTGALSVHTTNSTASNGLAEPGLIQGDVKTGVSTYAFGGDLFGNLWKFDLTSSTSTGASVFIAKDAGGAAQPITSLTSLTYDSATNSTFALFGTGKYLSSADISNAQVQTWYGLRVGTGADLSGTALTTAPVVTNTTTRTALTPRYAVDVGTIRATSLQVANDMNNKAGWYMDLPQTGERIVNRTQFIAGKAVVTTLIPKVNDPCNTVPAGAVMGVDPFTGANQVADYGLGTTTITYKNAAGQTVTATVAINGQVLAAGPAGGVTAIYTADGKVNITFNTLGGGQVNLGPLDLGGGTSGRVSWRELVN